MNYIDEIFERLDIQHIREFLLHGVEEMNVSEKSYKERVEEKENSALEFFEDQYPDTDEYEKVTDKVFDYATACQDVYMEIGMQCGAVLAMQLLRGAEKK